LNSPISIQKDGARQYRPTQSKAHAQFPQPLSLSRSAATAQAALNSSRPVKFTRKTQLIAQIQ
jgi:hypothetical protein